MQGKTSRLLVGAVSAKGLKVGSRLCWSSTLVSQRVIFVIDLVYGDLWPITVLARRLQDTPCSTLTSC